MLEIVTLAEALYQAEKTKETIAPFTDRFPQMTPDQAYQVQLQLMQMKIAKDLETVVGMKIGMTSRGMQKLLNIDIPDYGHLTDAMMLREGEVCHMQELISPKVEGEIAFCLKKDLKGPGVTVADVYNAVEYIAPSIEVVDSRINDWRIKLCDTIADNGSSARFVIGARMTKISQVDLRLVGMTMEKNGQLLSSGTGAEVWGNPAAAVAWLANTLSAYSEELYLHAGQIIMSGALTAADPAIAGDCYTVSFDGMGSISLRFA